jgi:hypothetical protein
VEPVKQFVQCLGVSKRPDQYIRLVSGTDRLRIWRLSDADFFNQQLDQIKTKFDNDLDDIKFKNSEALTQLMADHNKKEADL